MKFVLLGWANAWMLAFGGLCSLSGVYANEAQTWPQSRGPNRDSQIVGPTWPDNLSAEQLTESWTVPISRAGDQWQVAPNAG